MLVPHSNQRQFARGGLQLAQGLSWLQCHSSHHQLSASGVTRLEQPDGPERDRGRRTNALRIYCVLPPLAQWQLHPRPVRRGRWVREAVALASMIGAGTGRPSNVSISTRERNSERSWTSWPGIITSWRRKCCLDITLPPRLSDVPRPKMYKVRISSGDIPRISGLPPRTSGRSGTP